MGRRYLAVSDLHLCDIEDHADGWKAYKGSRHLFDDELIALIERFEGDGPAGDELTLVLNGDIVDFDLVTVVPDAPPWPVSPTERWRGLDPTEPKSAWKLQYVLGFHPALVRALARFSARGHRIVWVLGNHDRELHFPAVQRVLLDAMAAAAAADGATLPEHPVRFEPWFYYVPGEIYAEHGQQFDYYNSFPNLLHPVLDVGGEQVLALPMGNLSNRQLMSRMGFFNPFATDYILNVYHYALHWLRHYAFTRRSILVPWFVGSLIVIFSLLRLKGRLLLGPRDHDGLAAVSERTGVPVETLRALRALHPAPITDRFFRVVREVWIDRVVLAILFVGGTVALGLSGAPAWVKVMVPLTGFPLLYMIYEAAVRGEGLHAIDHHLPAHARDIAALLPARVVTFGHTHHPRVVPLHEGVTFVDTGTWAPILDGQGRRQPGFRNYLLARFDGERAAVELGSCDGWRGFARHPAGALERARDRWAQRDGALTSAG